MDNNWTYYEYADDLIARMAPNSGGAFEVYVGGKWKPSLDMVRFSDTAQKIENPGEYMEQHPDLKPAFSGGVSSRIAAAKDRYAASEGEWRTINGAHVQIGEGGTIVKGPAALKEKLPKSSVSRPSPSSKASSVTDLSGARPNVEKPVPGEAPQLKKAVQELGAQAEPTTAPPPGKVYNPNPEQGKAARVGVPGGHTPPLPPMNHYKLPNLNPQERKHEESFMQQYEADPDGAADKLIQMMASGVGDGPNVFATDEAKNLYADWKGTMVAGPDGKMDFSPETKAFRSEFNTALHATANALAKRAFVKYLDDVVSKLPEEKKHVLVTAGGVACHGKDTPILMFDGSLKMVQDVIEGDKVMGPDSTERTVMTTHSGQDAMYRVIPCRGDAFTVNGSHILSLKATLRKKSKGIQTSYVDVVNISVDDLLAKSNRYRSNSYLYRSGVEFPEKPVILDPYFLGLWLGNGTSSVPSITNADEEITKFLEEFVATMPELHLMVYEKPDNKASTYQLTQIDCKAKPGDPYRAGSHANPITAKLKQLGVFRDKHIPHCYLVNSREVRLGMLAGLLDTDSYLDVTKNTYEFTTKIEQVAYEVQFLARSLGFQATIKLKHVRNPWTGTMGVYHRIHIGGNDLNTIPTRNLRKQAFERPKKRSDGHTSRNVLHTSYRIELIGEDEFFGFTLDKDHLYLLGDFTVTHNSGKGYALKNVDKTKSLTGACGAVWDTAGEQNSTELDWVAQECKKRGLKMSCVFVHSNPVEKWENPKMGVIQRAQKIGRMVDARPFADSYTFGAQNFHKFHQKYANDPNVAVTILDATKPDGISEIPRLPDDILNMHPDQLYGRCVEALAKAPVNEAVKRGGAAGTRIWPDTLPQKVAS